MAYYSSSSYEDSGYYVPQYSQYQPLFTNSIYDSYNTQYNYYDQQPQPYSASSYDQQPQSYSASSYDQQPHSYSASSYDDYINSSTTYDHYYSSQTQPLVSYSAYHPHYVSYCSIVQDPGATTQFVISHNSVEPVNSQLLEGDLDFDEYDKTPFGGGYNIDLAYGKPLPTSDKTCYPPSAFDPTAPKADDVSVSGIVAPYGKDEKEVKETPMNGSKNNEEVAVAAGAVAAAGVVAGAAGVAAEQQKKHHEEKQGEKQNPGSNMKEEAAVAAAAGQMQQQEEDFISDGDITDEGEDYTDDEAEDEEEEEEEEEEESNLGEIDNSAPVQDSGVDNGTRNYNNGGYAEKMRQLAPGYGLEATDICESLFGYWPCLVKRRNQMENSDARDNHNPEGVVVEDKDGYYNSYNCYSSIDEDCCKSTVDYLFGNPNPYGVWVSSQGNYGNPVSSYASQRQFHQPPLYQQQHEDHQYQQTYHSDVHYYGGGGTVGGYSSSYGY